MSDCVDWLTLHMVITVVLEIRRSFSLFLVVILCEGEVRFIYSGIAVHYPWHVRRYLGKECTDHYLVICTTYCSVDCLPNT